MKKFFIIFSILVISSNAYADFKKIKKKAIVDIQDGDSIDFYNNL